MSKDGNKELHTLVSASSTVINISFCTIHLNFLSIFPPTACLLVLSFAHFWLVWTAILDRQQRRESSMKIKNSNLWNTLSLIVYQNPNWSFWTKFLIFSDSWMSRKIKQPVANPLYVLYNNETGSNMDREVSPFYFCHHHFSKLSNFLIYFSFLF